jgi:hypothetical protein
MADSGQFNYIEGFRRGLLPETDVQVDQEFLATCYQFKPTQRGLVGIETPTYPVGNRTQTVETQFLEGTTLLLSDFDASPEMFLGVVDQSTYTVGSDILTAGQLPSADDGSTLVTAEKNTPFVFAEATDIWFMSNGTNYLTNCNVYKNAVAGGWVIGHEDDVVVPKAVAMYENRMVMGGLHTNSGALSNSLWTKSFNAWRNFSEAVGVTDIDESIGGGHLFYGMLSGGSMNIPFALENILLSGFVTASDLSTQVIDAFSSGEMGFVRIPWQGEILGVKQLGNRCIVYGDRGIGVLSPAQNNTFVITQFESVKGVASTTAFAGDESEHVFVDTEGTVWRISSDFQLARLGYSDYIGTSNVIVNRDPRENDYYIDSGNGCFILSRAGLGKCRYEIRSMIVDGSNIYAVFTDLGTIPFEVKTHVITMDTRRRKILREVDLNIRDCGTKTIAVEYKSGDVAWAFDTTQSFNVYDVAHTVIQGTDFRVKLGGLLSGTRPTIDSMKIAWRPTEYRFLEELV